MLVDPADFPPTTIAPIDAIDGAADVYIENTGTIIGGQNRADITFSPVESVQIYAGGEVSVDDASSVGLSGRAGAAVKF